MARKTNRTNRASKKGNGKASEETRLRQWLTVIVGRLAPRGLTSEEKGRIMDAVLEEAEVLETVAAGLVALALLEVEDADAEDDGYEDDGEDIDEDELDEEEDD